jgi:hypothetical protein
MVVDDGKLVLVDAQTGHTAQESFEIGLYTNTITITNATVLGDLVEPTQAGYARQATGSFGASTINCMGQASAVPGAPVTFTNNDGAVDIMATGFFWYGVNSGKLIAATNFGATVVIAHGGGTQQFLPDFLGTTI